VPTTSLQGSLQASPMSHISAAPPKDGLVSVGFSSLIKQVKKLAAPLSLGLLRTAL